MLNLSSVVKLLGAHIHTAPCNLGILHDAAANVCVGMVRSESKGIFEER